MLPRRKAIRLRGYDYTRPGAYFVTVGCHGRQCLFGAVGPGIVRLSPAGEIVSDVWQGLGVHSSNIETDAFIVMPNHVHGILFLHMGEDPAKHSVLPNASPLRGSAPAGTVAGSLSAVIQNFKAVSTRIVHARGFMVGEAIWQRGFYERVIRGEEELARIRRYIEDNPVSWPGDPDNPSRSP